MPSKKLIVYGTKSEQTQNILFVSENDFEPKVYEKAQYTPITVTEIQNSKINSKDFLEYFDYNGISFYWFMYPAFRGQFTECTNFIDRFIPFLEKNNPDSLYLNDDFSKFYLIKQICEKKNIIFSYSKKNFIKFLLRSKLTPLIRKNRLKQSTYKKISSRISLYKKKFSKQHTLKNKIIFSSPDVYRRHRINLKTGTLEEGEFLIDDLTDFIPDGYSTLGISLDYNVYGNLPKFERRLNSDMDWIPMELFLEDFSLSKKQSTFLKNFKKLLTDQKFQSIFSYHGISLWKQLESTFFQMTFAPYFPLWMKLIETLIVEFQKNPPRAIFLPYETGPLALCFIVAAKKTNISTFGIQHGIIAPRWKYYSFNPLDVAHKFGFPLPDKLLLFGDFSKRILLKNGYPAEKLITFGNPSFFNLDEKKKILEKTNIKQKFGIPNNKTIILYPTLSMQKFKAWSTSNHNTEIWNHLLSNFGNNNNYFFILKTHPDENPSLYKEIVKKYDVSNVLITTEGLNELIFISDIVVSMFGTTIIDSLCFQKPVIQVEFDDMESPISLSTLGVTLPTKLDTLHKVISDFSLNNPNVITTLDKSKNFVNDLFCIPEKQPELIIKKILET